MVEYDLFKRVPVPNLHPRTPLKNMDKNTASGPDLPIEICGSGKVEECTGLLSPGHHDNVQPSMLAIRQGQPKRQK
jgi:hypothetical protein